MPKPIIILLGLLFFSKILGQGEAADSDAYYQFYDSQGHLLLETGQSPHVGDLYIHEDNTLYEVTKIAGKHIDLMKKDQISLTYPETRPVQAPPTAPTLAIYHSHTDESYIPADGTATRPGKGTILRLGETFAENLRQKNYLVLHDQTLHDPHDANAYLRSRRTVFKLLQQQPSALFDLHRDSAPIEGYVTTIKGQETAKILLVVGRSNPQQPKTLEYAKTIKSASDSQYKGLIRGIFIAHGDYNQDLSPQSILVEVGTQYNNLDQANRAVTLFADVVPLFIANQINQAAPPPVAAGEAPLGDVQNPAKGYIYHWLFLLSAIILSTGIYFLLNLGNKDPS